MRRGASAFAERVRGSLFVIPMVFVIVAVVLGELGILLDSSIGSGTDKAASRTHIHGRERAGSAQHVAGATITFAGSAFSVSLLTIDRHQVEQIYARHFDVASAS